MRIITKRKAKSYLMKLIDELEKSIIDNQNDINYDYPEYDGMLWSISVFRDLKILSKEDCNRIKKLMNEKI